MKSVLISGCMVVSLFAISQEALAKKSYEVISGYESSISNTTMILRNVNGEENIRKMEFSKLENKEGDKSLMYHL